MCRQEVKIHIRGVRVLLPKPLEVNGCTETDSLQRFLLTPFLSTWSFESENNNHFPVKGFFFWPLMSRCSYRCQVRVCFHKALCKKPLLLQVHILSAAFGLISTLQPYCSPSMSRRGHSGFTFPVSCRVTPFCKLPLKSMRLLY